MPVQERDPHALKEPTSQTAARSARAISWSKYGFITYAHPDPTSGHNMCLTYLENTNGKDWQLAKATGITLKPLDDGAAAEIDMLKWSNLLTDLGVWDVNGNFYILLAGVGLINDKKGENGQNGTANGAISAPSPTKRDSDGPSYELTSYNHTEMIYRDIVPPQAHTKCVSFEWLNIEKPQIVNKLATLAGEDGSGYANYSYGVTQHHPPGTSHPIPTKQACVAVRQNGLLNLYYQGEHKVEYHKLSYNLAPDGREGSCTFTKAAIGFNNDKKIVIVAYDARSDLILTYVVSIDWGFLVDSAQRQRADPHYHTPKDGQNQPLISCSLVHEMRPEPTASIDYGDEKAFGRPEVVQQTLKLIELFSPFFQQGSSLEILVTYECMNPVGSQPFTLAYRYNLENAMDSVGDLFDSMGDGASNSDSREGLLRLVLQGHISLSKQVQQIETAISESLLLFIYTDGSIDAVNRETWEIIPNPGLKIEGQDSSATFPPTISSLLDCGFLFPELGANPALLAVSPNMAAFVHHADGQLQFKSLERLNGKENILLCGIGFAYMHACACYSTTSSDDLLVMLRNELLKTELELPELASKLVDLVMTESHKAINFQLNSFGKESVDKLLSNPPLQRLLSLQLVLGELHSDNRAIKDMAWIVLNLRSTSFGIMFSLSSIYRQMSKKKPAEDLLQDSVSRAECIMLLVGNVRWLIDLIVYFNQELLQLAFSRNRPSQSKVTVDNSVVLPVILGKVPRLFLMYSLSSIGKTHEILKKLYKELTESNKLYTPMKEALNRFFTACNSLPLNLGLFENFLRECEVYVNKELNNVVSNDRAQLLRLEQQLFCRGHVPDEVKYMANVLIDRHAATISRDLKLSDLYFYENNWIDVGIARKEFTKPYIPTDDEYKPMVPRLRYSDNEVVDALRKIIINAGPTVVSGGASAMGKGYSLKNKIRKCTRCRAVSLVADPSIFDGPGGFGVWTMVFQRTCICGNAWVNCL